MRTVAVVLAGGSGLRFGGSTPKQFQLLGGRTLVEHCVAAFDAAPAVDEVLVVIGADYVATAAAQLGRYDKLVDVIAGGSARTDSTQQAIAAITAMAADAATSPDAPMAPAPEAAADNDPADADQADRINPDRINPDRTDPTRTGDSRRAARIGRPGRGSRARQVALAGGTDCNVLFHDAARPLVTQEIIADCVTALDRWQAIGVVVPSSDTIVEVADGTLGRVLPRGSLARCQTPQGFRLSVIERAYRAAAADPGFAAMSATDDCGVVRRYLPDVQIGAVPGSERNMKITYPGELAVAEALLRQPADNGANPE